jgi:uncharacterized protein (TIGR02246 family)
MRVSEGVIVSDFWIGGISRNVGVHDPVGVIGIGSKPSGEAAISSPWGAHMPYNLEDQQALQVLTARLDTAWTGQDGRGFAACFAEESALRYHTGRTLQGRGEIEQNYLAYFASKPEQERHVTLIRHVRFLRPDVAVIDGHVDIWRQQELRLHLLATFVVTKEVGTWLISDVCLAVPVS